MSLIQNEIVVDNYDLKDYIQHMFVKRVKRNIFFKDCFDPKLEVRDPYP